MKMRRTDVIPIRNQMLKKQNGICPLCRTPIPDDMAVLDHSHQHGYIRAVLCRNCNAMEGKVMNLANRAKRTGTPLEWLAALVEYETVHDIPQSKFMHHLHKTEVEKKVARLKKQRMKRAEIRKKLLGNKHGEANSA